MKKSVEKAGWSRRYRTALRKHIECDSGASPRLMQSLGQQAVSLGLETLDLAQAHEQALSHLISIHDSARIRARAIKRAREFFAETAIRIEKTHRAAMAADALIRQLDKTLHKRTRDSEISTRLVKQTILKRQAGETALKKNAKNHVRLLAESQGLLKQLRDMTRTCLSAQEDTRKDVSQQLQDEIAQSLLGIHVRLLSLKKAIKVNIGNLKNEIGTTQHLVQESVRKVNRFAHEYGTTAKI